LHLKNPDTSAGFYWISQNKTASTAVVPFSLNVETSVGNVTIPNVRLDGRESKIVVTDYTFGEETLLFSSAEVLTYGKYSFPYGFMTGIRREENKLIKFPIY